MAVTLGVIGLGLGLVGIATGVTAGVIGGIASHNQAKEQAEYAEANARLQQAQMEYNQRQELREAATIEREAQINALRQREESNKLKAAQRALLGKSGAALTTGSPLAILGATAADEETKIRDIHYLGARSAAASTAKAADYGFGATIAGHNASAAKASRPSGASLAANITGTVGRGVAQLGSLALGGANLYNNIGK